MKKDSWILVVDDDRELLQALGEQLEATTFKISFAATATEALNLAGNSPGTLALLLTDVMLPDLNGIELAKTLRQRQPGLKIAFMSGYLRPAAPVEQPGQAPDHFLQKPFSGKTLLGFIRKSLALAEEE